MVAGIGFPGDTMRFGVGAISLFAVVGAGCAPPPLNGGDPQIHLLYPQPGSSELYFDEDDNLHMRLDADNFLRFTVVVGLENVEFVPPATEPVDGQAHWHVFIDEDYKAPDALYAETEFDLGAEPGIGDLHTLKVHLQRNDHAELDCVSEGECTDADVEDSVEFTLDPPIVDGG
jgi:hypothetical protein